MSEIKHPSLKAELLYLIGRATAPMSCAELYEKCELADEVAQAAKALANLQSDGNIVRVPGEGRARYTLAAGVAAPAPAGKAGRSKAVQADDAAHAQSAAKPDHFVDADTMVSDPMSVPPALDIPAFDDWRAKGRAEAAHHAAAAERVLRKADKHEARRSDESLADAIIARLKRDLGPLLRPPITADLDVVTTTAPGAIHISVESVEINISIGVGA